MKDEEKTPHYVYIKDAKEKAQSFLHRPHRL